MLRAPPPPGLGRRLHVAQIGHRRQFDVTSPVDAEIVLVVPVRARREVRHDRHAAIGDARDAQAQRPQRARARPDRAANLRFAGEARANYPAGRSLAFVRHMVAAPAGDEWRPDPRRPPPQGLRSFDRHTETGHKFVMVCVRRSTSRGTLPRGALLRRNGFRRDRWREPTRWRKRQVR
jgi:hypothetical protein